VLLIYVPRNHVSSYVGCHVHSYFENCNAEGFSKTSSELLEEGTIRRGVEAGNDFILWVGKLRPHVSFVMSFIFCRTFSCSEKLVECTP
jgi:hypothetical protein